MKKKLVSNLTTVILVAAFLVGLCLLLYPSFSNYWNQFHQSRAISRYAESVAAIDDDTYKKMWNDAVEYNKSIANRALTLEPSESELAEYSQLLKVDETGMMAYIEIPKIHCFLPIYHGTDEGVLQIAIGHLAGTSLPVGGKSTHCVLSGHRGLPSAKLFTDIDQLIVGDTFMIRTLDETLTYEVDQILIVLPEEVESLAVEKGKDYCTLVTCTPYGINTHRLLVRGHRIDNLNLNVRATADAQQIEPVIVAPLVAMPMLFILLVIVLIDTRKRKERMKRLNSRRKRAGKHNE